MGGRATHDSHQENVCVGARLVANTFRNSPRECLRGRKWNSHDSGAMSERVPICQWVDEWCVIRVVRKTFCVRAWV
jgi:hypothetical protein